MSSATLASVPRLQRLAVAREVARRVMPYFSVGIAGLGFIEASGLGTMAVTADGRLMVDLDAIADETALETATGLIHEYMHVFLEHEKRWRALLGTLRAKDADKHRWNQACDLEINDGLVRSGLPRTFGKQELLLPSAFEFADDLSAEQYFSMLESKTGSLPQPSCGAGWCGSGAGNPAPNEPELKPGAKESFEVRAAITAMSVAAQVGASESAFGGAGRGVLPPPTPAKRRAGHLTKLSKVPWEKLLAQAARRAAQLAVGDDDYTYELPSRQQQALCGFDPCPILPATRKLRAEVALVVDTSGSMGGDSFDLILREAKRVLGALPGCRISMIACDAAVHVSRKVKSVEEIRESLVGGGGTAFEPAFAELDRIKPRPDVVVFATDGYGSYPSSPPAGMRVIWLLTPGGRIAVPWGTVVQAENPQSRDKLNR